MIWSSITGIHVKKWNEFSRQLFCYIITNMTIVTEKAASKSQMSADFLIHEKFSQIMKLLPVGVQSHLNGFQLLVRGHSHYVSHLQLNLRGMFQIYS
jgi:hypothetical protein